MNPFGTSRSAVALFAVMISAAVGIAQVAPTTAAVELIVRSPQGQPLVNAPISILPDERFYPVEKPAPVDAKTDDKGRVRFSWPVGIGGIRLAAKGVGYGATGSFEVVEAQTARPLLPPLVPFGSIEGTVPKEVLRSGTDVKLPDRPYRTENRAGCDEKGRFVLQDVPCGTYWLQPRLGDQTLGVGAAATVLPGQRVRAVFRKYDEPAPVVVRRTKETVVWAGTVRDESGRAVEGAAVYLVVNYHGGIRMYEVIQSAQTDKQGRWQIEPEEGLGAMFSGTLLVHKAGHPPAAVTAPVPAELEILQMQKEARKRIVNCDLILPSRGGGLEVTVYKDGKSLAGAVVGLSPEHGTQLSEPAYVGAARGPAREKVEPILYPVAKTDKQGVARFENLAPGTYEVSACSGGTEEVRGLDRFVRSDNRYPHGMCRGVAVRSGEKRQFVLTIYLQPNKVHLQVLQSNGQPPPVKSAAITWGRDFGRGLTSSVDLDNGKGQQVFEGPGLWHVQLRYRNSPTRWIPIREAPFFEAAAVVGVSPSLPEDPATVLTAHRRQPGSIAVELRDVNDKPAHGFVMIDRFFGEPAFAASTNDRGLVRFEGVPAWNHEIEAYLPGTTLPDLYGEVFPDDKELVGRVAFFKQTVTTSLDSEATVIVRPKPVGYVRGVLRPPKGHTCADCWIQHMTPEVLPDWGCNYNTKSGEFVLGPLPEGKASIHAGCFVAASNSWPRSAQSATEVQVRGDRVARVELTPAPSKPEEDGRHQGVVIGSGVITRGAKPVASRVVLPDGKTPAFAARLVHLVSGRPVQRGTTDALGRPHGQHIGFPTETPKRERPGSPTEPVLVAWLPGAHGATVIPVKQATAESELKLVLPPSIIMHGKVTVGGKDVQGRNNQFHILAAHEGKGQLGDLLSVRVSAAADGTFELAGLTPGTYSIQAAMDDIWLSPSTRLIVGSEMGPERELTLNIGEPGAGSRIEVINRQGKPVAGTKVTIIRPKGPLTESLWPFDFTSDGAGVVQVPPLEAGTHQVRIHGVAKEKVLVVPPLSAPRTNRGELRVVMD